MEGTFDNGENSISPEEVKASWQELDSDMKVSPEIIKSLLDYEPVIPEITVPESAKTTVFKGQRIQKQPDSFNADRQGLLYIANDDLRDGDRLIINDREYRMGGRFMRNFCWYIDLAKGPRWFLSSFNTETRDRMVRELIAVKGSREFRFFYENAEESDESGVPTLINLVPQNKPVISDLEGLEIVEEALGGNLEVKNFAQTDNGLVIQLLTEHSANIVPELGDIVRMGLEVHLSQLGWISPQTALWTHRLSCLNGMTTPNIMKAYGMADRKAALTDSDLRNWLKDSVQSGVASFDYYVTKMMEAAKEDASPTVLADLVAKYRLSRKTATAIDTAFAKEPGETVWAVANAVTRAAREGGFTFEEQIRLEQIAGSLVLL